MPRLHSTDDPRIFRPGLRRQYPYHKQRSWSPQYMCSPAMPRGQNVVSLNPLNRDLLVFIGQMWLLNPHKPAQCSYLFILRETK